METMISLALNLAGLLTAIVVGITVAYVLLTIFGVLWHERD